MADKVFLVVSSGDREVVKWPALTYALNAKKRKWMDDVKVIIFGPAEELAARDSEIQAKLREVQEAGVEVLACKACSDDWNITDSIERAGFKVEYVGPIISQLLKDGWASLTF